MIDLRSVLLAVSLALPTVGARALEATPTAEGAYCGDEGVWLQVLGSGGPEIDDGAAGPAYLVWQDGRARVLVDAGPGSSVNFDRAGADFDDLDAIAVTHLHVDHVNDLPAFLKGSRFLDRGLMLPVFGPEGNDRAPSTSAWVRAQFDAERGPYPYLADVLEPISEAGYRVSVRDVPSRGREVWSGFRREDLRLAAIPVEHGDFPALAWRVEIGEQVITFTGDASNRRQTIEALAEGSDVVVVHHAVHEAVRGPLRELHMPPSQIGKLAAAVDPRFVVLSHRMNRTRGRESQSRREIEAHWTGTLIFANDLDCYGLGPAFPDADASGGAGTP